VGELMIIIPEPEANPMLCLMIEKRHFNQDEHGNVTVEGPENARMYELEGAVLFCTEHNNKLQNK
jgi:hypothetical protein